MHTFTTTSRMPSILRLATQPSTLAAIRHQTFMSKAQAARKLTKMSGGNSFFFTQYAPLRTTSGPLGSITRRTFAGSYGSNPYLFYRSTRTAVWSLIGINTAVFSAWFYAVKYKDSKLLRQLHANATLSWVNIRCQRYYTIITSAFSHMEPVHFIFNMMALHAFGSVLMMIPGVHGTHITFLALGSAIAGSCAWLYHQKEQASKTSVAHRSGLFGRSNEVIYANTGLGASGMVSGLGAAATFLFPRAPMAVLIFPAPLWVITTGYFLVDAYFLDSGSRIGHAAHLGGSIFGGLFYFAFLRKFGGIWQFARRMVRR